ncbi:MAG TPA: response regulator [Chthoniobacterales bacterium]|nr:response regulator [Chthoniobacterales bacterium]
MPTAVHSWNPSAERASKVCSFDKASVCLLDDDLSMLKALDRLLKSDGFNVERFHEPDAFLAAVGKRPCRVAILDVWMPDMNGLEVQAALQKTAPETRVIFMSGRDDPSVRETALEAGAYGFLSKPFDDEVFLQLVRKAVTA